MEQQAETAEIPSKRPRVSATAADSVTTTAEVPEQLDDQAPNTSSNVLAEAETHPGEVKLQESELPSKPNDEQDKADKVPSTDNEGLYRIVNPGKRLLLALDKGFLTDATILVRNEAVKCHSLILSTASPKLAAILEEKEPRLPNVDPRPFRLLLEIIYSGATRQQQDVDTLVQVGRLAYKLKVLAAVKFCASSLAEYVVTENLWPILDFAHLARDVNLARICLEVICNSAGSILQSEGFMKCNLFTLELILKQNTLCGVTELQLFNACLAWVYAKSDDTESRRVALGSAMCWIRFRLLSAEEFSKHVCPTGLLSVEHERDILRSCATGENFIPERFSTDIIPRDPARHPVEMRFSSSGNRKTINQCSKNVNIYIPLSVTRNTFILGVKLHAWRLNQPVFSRYQEAIYVSLRDSNCKSFEEVMFYGEVKKGCNFMVKLKKPFELIRNVGYFLEVNYITEDTNTYKLYKQQILNSNSGLQICVLYDFLAPPGLHIIVANKLPA